MRSVRPLATLAAIPLLFTACGGGGDSSSTTAGTGSATTGGEASTVTVLALDTRFDQKQYTAVAGQVTFDYDSKGSLVHSFKIDGVADFRLQVAPGKTTSGTVGLAAGSYTVYCDIPGHRASGMEATLTVN